MIWIYNILVTLLSPIWVPWMLWRANRRKEKVNWKERSGDYQLNLRPGSRRLWFHAVSVGEVVAATPILREIRKLAPDAEIILSVTTSSGHQTALDQAIELFDHLVYFPIDVPRFCLAALSRVRPHVVAIMETELWLNFLWTAKNLRAKTVLVNGRISDRSFPRAMRLRAYYVALFNQLDDCLMQTALDKERILSLGAQNAEVIGNCKFDQAMEGIVADAEEWRGKLGIPAGAPVVVVGSTRGEFEERLILVALAPLRERGLVVVHAPRHLERVAELKRIAEEVWGSAVLRSSGLTGSYMILDTYGELASIYSVADLVIVGGGFADLGGQNLFQPLASGKPVLHGPHMQNFREIADLAARENAAMTVRSAAELSAAIARLLDDPDERNAMGARARNLTASSTGAASRYANRLVKLLETQ